jgi:hypothetical protein
MSFVPFTEPTPVEDTGTPFVGYAPFVTTRTTTWSTPRRVASCRRSP